jgi:hypothetical protein
MVRDDRVRIEQIAPESGIRGTAGGGEICRRAPSG